MIMSHKKNLNQSLSLSKLNCQLKDTSSEILKLVNAKSKGELYTKFVCNFLKYIPVDYRSTDKVSMFTDFTEEAFDFFKDRPKLKRKILINNEQFQNNAAISILIVAENRPFIIDSLNSLMDRLSLNTIFTFHPVINSVRNKKGELEDIAEKGMEGVNESLICIKALGTYKKDVMQKIEEEINKIIDLVDYTYHSWQTLLNKLTDITADITQHKDTYDKINLPAEETLDFLNWLQKNNITFLGAVDFNAETSKITHQEGVEAIWKDNISEISTIIEYSKSDYYQNKLAMLGKINKISPVHRNALVDYILIKKIDKHGKYKGGSIIFGLYGTAIYFQSIKNIPILRGKMSYVLDESGFPLNGYNAKKIKNIIESLPRDILIQIDDNDLYCMCAHMLSSMRSHKLKLFMQQDWSGSFVNVIIFMPRHRLTPQVYNKISCYLKEKFNSNIIADNITVVAQNFSHLFTTLPIKNIEELDIDAKAMEQDLVKLTTSWSDSFMNKLCDAYGEYEASVKYKDLIESFSQEYQHRFEAINAIEDMHFIKKASENKKVLFNLSQGDKGEYFLKFYSPKSSLTLSETLPSIENLGFIAINEESFVIKESSIFNKCYLYQYRLKSPVKINESFDKLKSNIEEALGKISEGVFANDSLNKLLVLSGLDWREVKMLKALTAYLHQTGISYGKSYVKDTLVKHYKYTEMLVDLFVAHLDPKNQCTSKVSELSKEMKKYLKTVKTSTEDKVLKNMQLVVRAVLRTNFFQADDKTGDLKEYISFKFNSAKVPNLPMPLPYAEIFVYSNDFEGIHLRGGKVARGGLRWSDRGEDYRTEVLGLMKSQMTKNTVIVPVGSKGAFYINFGQGDDSREDYMQKVVNCYQNYLRGMLDITDNLVHGKIVQPENTVIYDDANPYLVVAADKGTATFSDFANEVSESYNFWLGDAFASGGSVGYDHKKMGITAKGAWISAVQHFQDMGTDIQNEPFTVIGIGDMSGDVFGNGMLLSEHIKLVAAFNHLHIFIDPNPDTTASFKERKRLFETPRTKWSDYNAGLLSTGGAIYERTAKSITISDEIALMLGITEKTLAPDLLIQHILKAKVDLIWNGGIGTYVKAESESNFDIGDKANDSLRVNGNELQARAVSEGGNLGLSQLGRVEYSLVGGVINTDFIDNSAGVDCSDHEVNIKIALNMAVASGKITTEERNDILAQMTEEVEELVLQDNNDQNLAITVMAKSPVTNIESFSHLMQELEASNILDSEVEFLPNKAELTRREMSGEGMTRPELSVLLSYSKMALDLDLSSASLMQDKHFEGHLYNYFPKLMQEKFTEEIDKHPLKQEIIRTIVTNKMINRLGGPIISSLKRETGAHPCDLARAYEVVVKIFDLETLWNDIVALKNSVDVEIKVEMLSDLGRIIRRGISWFVRNVDHPIPIQGTIDEYAEQTRELTKIISKLLVGSIKSKYLNKIEKYSKAGVNKNLAKSVSTLEVLVSAFDIIYIAKQIKSDNQTVANLYFECGNLFSLDWLRYSCDAKRSDSYWHRLSLQSLKDDFYDKQRVLVTKVAQAQQNNINFNSWLKINSSNAGVFNEFIEELKMQEHVDFDMIILANKKLEIFLKKLKIN